MLKTPKSLFQSALLLSVLLLFAQSAGARSFFWTVSKGSASVHLLGSVHVAKPDYYPLAPEIERAFKQSDVLAVEVNPLTPEAQQGQQMLMQRAIYSGNDSLQKHISRSSYKLLLDYLQQNNLPEMAFVRMKPAIIAMTLSLAKLATLGYSPSNGIDMYFLQKAGDRPIKELESIEMQTDLLLNLPEAETFLRYTVEHMDQIESVMTKVDRAWKSGDAASLERYMITEVESKYPQMKRTNQKLLYDRNIGMSDKIEGYLNSGKTHFVVVGSGHLIGDQGIVSILEKRGYSSKQY